LNTGTIRGQKLPLEQAVDLVAAAGYDGIEPWIGEIETYVKNGGRLPDLRKRIADRGLIVESAIGFAAWIAEDEAQRRAGLEQAKRDMDLLRQIGGTRIAAPPAGGTQTKFDLLQIAERYRALLAAGAEIGVTPQVEIWGPSANLSRLGEAVFVAIESGRRDACLLPDVYHVYKGGSDFAGFKMVAGTSMHCFHMNDYPADPPRETIGDKDRVYPGDGIAPLSEILQTIAAAGFSGALSLELFNREYWAQDAALVVRTGLEKMQAAVAKAFA
jgi:sugar phosphate isomerase/epimerase